MKRDIGWDWLADDIATAIAQYHGVAESELGAKWIELAKVFAQLVHASGVGDPAPVDKVKRLLGLVSDAVLAVEGVTE